MKKFLDDTFLLHNQTAVTLFNTFAKDMPIIDYHCHLNPQEIYENKQFRNITEAWLDGDHYKWRLMRANGVDEEFITGDGDDYEKFLAWARTIPKAIGNPLYHWTHLELQRFFGITEVLNEKNAPRIWEKANALLEQDGFRARDFILKSNVEVICTTDDPVDTLEYHQKIKEDEDFPVKVLPSFRPDKGLDINGDHFLGWIEKLQEVSGVKITTYDDLLQALKERIDFFHSLGGRVSDHGLNTVVYEEATKDEVDTIFAKALAGEKVTEIEEKKYKTYTLIFLGQEYAEKNWVMQLHMNVLRNTNTRMFQKLGPDAGFDSIGDDKIAVPLMKFLDALDKTEQLPKTILYSLNPTDNYIIGTMIGNFQGGGIPGKIQFGTAWWFNDQIDGMRDQMKTLANVGLFGQFIGMLTDSRSFLSFTRHEYFRRILCDIIGEWVEKGEYPRDMDALGEIVRGICYENAKAYFQFDEVS